MATYTTKAGDMWDQIAHNELGDANKIAQLMECNQQYRNYYIFPSGIVLMLPEVAETVSRSLPPWKQKSDKKKG